MGSSASDTHIDCLNSLCPRCASFAHLPQPSTTSLERGFFASLYLLLEPATIAPSSRRKPAGSRKRGRPPSETGPSPAPKEKKAAEAEAEASEAMGDDAQESDSSDHMEYAYEDDDDEDEEGLMVLDAQRSYSRRPSSTGFSSRTGSSSSNSGDDEEMVLASKVGASARRSGDGVKGASYTILTIKDLEIKQAALVGDLADRLSLGSLPAKLLLRRYGWNVRSVCDDHFDEAMDMIEAMSKSKEKPVKKRGSSRQTFKCGICWEACPVTVRMCLPNCSHAFCRDCLAGHFRAKIDEGASKLLPCIQPECHELYPEDVVLDVVDEAYGEKYAKQNVTYFVTENPRIKFCPGPDCDLAAEIKEGSSTAPVSILCECGHRWCFSCMEPPHLPLPCEYQRLWKEKTTDDGEMATVQFIKLTTKICPWCKSGVNKQENTCNYMTCRCGENFCYKCGGKVKRGSGHTWNTIEHHECGRLPEVDAQKGSDLVRFMHYLSYFKAQRLMPEKSRREAGAEREEMEDIMLVNRSRKILANSYVFAFYAFQDGSPLASRRVLFEDKQQQLENMLEVFCKMIADREKHLEGDPKRPPDQDFKSQRDLVKHWLLALYGTLEKDILEDDAYGITIPEFEPEAVVYDA